jgi:hypothetical protein
LRFACAAEKKDENGSAAGKEAEKPAGRVVFVSNVKVP